MRTFGSLSTLLLYSMSYIITIDLKGGRILASVRVLHYCLGKNLSLCIVFYFCISLSFFIIYLIIHWFFVFSSTYLPIFTGRKIPTMKDQGSIKNKEEEKDLLPKSLRKVNICCIFMLPLWCYVHKETLQFRGLYPVYIIG